MSFYRTMPFLYPLVMFMLAAGSAFGQGQSINVIMRGKVVLEDGSPLTKSVGLQKICSDGYGNAPGPLTNKDGTYIWRMDLSYMSTRRCFLESTASGYDSTQVEISNINPVGMNVDVPPIIISLKGSDPYVVGNSIGGEIPGKSKSAFDAAIKAVASGDNAGAIEKLQGAVEATPKFALGWHNLGVLYTFERDDAKARDAFEKAAEADSKLLAPRIILSRLMIKNKEWDKAAKMAAAAIPLDKGKVFPELYLHQAVAEYHLKDLTAAENHAKQALDPKSKRSVARAEYVMGRILEAKGDTAGAKQHMTKYLELVPMADDAAVIKAHIDNMGKPDAPEPDLEVITR